MWRCSWDFCKCLTQTEGAAGGKASARRRNGMLGDDFFFSPPCRILDRRECFDLTEQAVDVEYACSTLQFEVITFVFFMSSDPVLPIHNNCRGHEAWTVQCTKVYKWRTTVVNQCIVLYCYLYHSNTEVKFLAVDPSDLERFCKKKKFYLQFNSLAQTL